MKNVKYKFKMKNTLANPPNINLDLNLSSDVNESIGGKSMKTSKNNIPFLFGKLVGTATALIMFGFLIGLGIKLAGRLL
jgi:hypothetical protein